MLRESSSRHTPCVVTLVQITAQRGLTSHLPGLRLFLLSGNLPYNILIQQT